MIIDQHISVYIHIYIYIGYFLFCVCIGLTTVRENLAVSFLFLCQKEKYCIVISDPIFFFLFFYIHPKDFIAQLTMNSIVMSFCIASSSPFIFPLPTGILTQKGVGQLITSASAQSKTITLPIPTLNSCSFLYIHSDTQLLSISSSSAVSYGKSFAIEDSTVYSGIIELTVKHLLLPSTVTVISPMNNEQPLSSQTYPCLSPTLIQYIS